MSDPGAPETAPGWYPDPAGRHQHRWWDGRTWTDQVATNGRQGTDAPGGTGTVPTTGQTPERIQRQVEQQAGVQSSGGGGGGTLFTEPVLVVNQKAKLIEVTNEYAVFDGQGRQLGAVREVGQSTARKVLRLLTNVDQFLTHSYQLVDTTGSVQLALTRPAKLLKSKIIVTGANGVEIGTIAQENAIGKIRFAFLVGGDRVGGIQAENWRAWNFSIRDAADVEVARITKTWEGLAKAMFTTADNYVVQVHRPLDEPLRSFVVASAVSVDTALKQDDR